MAFGSLKHEVARDQRPPLLLVALEQLDEDLVEVLQLQGVPTGLDGDVVVRDAGQYLDPVGQAPAQFQIQGRVHGQILVVAEKHTARDAPALVESTGPEQVAVELGWFVAEGIHAVPGSTRQSIRVLVLVYEPE